MGEYGGDVQFGRLRNSRNLRKNRTRVVRLQRSVTKLRGLIAERHHYCREFWSINDFILRNWGACVDIVSGHVSLDTHLELMKHRSVGWVMVASLQKSCRWRNDADGGNN